MKIGILGRKVGMTQVYDDGKAVPVTVIEAGPCNVLQIRDDESDGYQAVQLGFLDKKRPQDGRSRTRASQARRSERGHASSKLNSKRSRRRKNAGTEIAPRAECEPQQFVRELRGSTEGYEIGQQVTVANLAEIIAVDVTATSKGRGFSGVMKRHNFSGQRATHGVKKVHRHAGGTGMSASPSRLFKGRKMAGRYGNIQVTIRNLQVVSIDEENNLIMVRGAIPGPNGGLLIVRETNKL
jgi:large subunit ribosomal protein L3